MTTPLLTALDLLRAQGAQIPGYDADRMACWFDGLAELLAELPNKNQRMAWVALIANDLCRRMPGLPLAMAAAPVLDRLNVMDQTNLQGRIV